MDESMKYVIQTPHEVECFSGHGGIAGKTFRWIESATAETAEEAARLRDDLKFHGTPARILTAKQAEQGV